jgi:acyl carrier protein
LKAKSAKESLMSQTIVNKLLDYITENFPVERNEIMLDRSLVDEGIIDSTGLVELIVFIEEEFSIAVEEDQMTKDNLGSVIKIGNFIERETDQQAMVLSKAV